jgi:uncharacterized protein (TIGR00369 family)
MDPVEQMQQRVSGFFPELLGIRFVTVEPERIVAELEVRREICTVPGVMHGGAVMSLADTLGAIGTMMNLREGQGTTTMESKTNFFGPGVEGTTIVAECIPLHRGGRTHVWETTIRNPSGKMIAKVTQTQMVLEPRT